MIATNLPTPCSHVNFSIRALALKFRPMFPSTAGCCLHLYALRALNLTYSCRSLPRWRRPWGFCGALGVATHIKRVSCGNAEPNNASNCPTILACSCSKSGSRIQNTGRGSSLRQRPEEIRPSVCPILSEPLEDYRDIPASIAASAIRDHPNKGGLKFWRLPASTFSATDSATASFIHSPHAARNASLSCVVWRIRTFVFFDCRGFSTCA